MRTGRIITVILGVFLVSFRGVAGVEAAGQEQRTPKVGLVLSGGGARGAAHIGVLKVLEREHIPIDYIVGTSFGALVGGLYSLGYSAVEIEELMRRQDWSAIFSDTPERRLAPLIERKSARYQGQLSFKGINPELPTGLLGGQRLTEILDLLTTERMLQARYDFDRLPIPFRAVATNLLDGTPYVFKQGRMTEALRASMAVPMLFTPIEKDGILLVDGGLANNLPTDVARDMGADIIIAVDATSPLLKKDEIRTVLNVMDQAISLLMQRRMEENRRLARVILKPDLESFSYNDYGQLMQIERRGEAEVEVHLEDLKAVLGNLAPQTHPTFSEGGGTQVIESIAFRGLNKIKQNQLSREIKAQAGKRFDPRVLRSDLTRLYATRLFDSVDYSLEAVDADRYRLTYLMKEAPLHTLGASIRYDNDYKLVALAEFTTHQLFGTPSVAILTAQFGGIENYAAALRYVPASLPFLYVEPKVQLRRRERLDIRNQVLVDKYTDKRNGGHFVIGGAFLKRLEIEMGYKVDSLSTMGGTAPRRQDDPLRVAGLTLRMSRDTLDAQDFPHGGMLINLQVDKRIEALGSDLSYSRWQADIDRYLSFSSKSTFKLNASAGYSSGAIPFLDQFYIGGYNFLEGAPRQLLGFDRDELQARQMAVIGASYRRQVFSRPFSFARRGYVTAFYNAVALSNQPQSPYHFQIMNGAGIGIALDSMLGPLRIAGGWGEGGRIRFYLSLGPGF